MIDDSTLVHQLTQTVRAVDGVLDIYPVAPTILAGLSKVASVLNVPARSTTGSAGPDSDGAASPGGHRVVSVSRDDAGSVTIRAHIGVDSRRATPDVTREVSDALAADAARLLGPDASVSICVKVSSIG